MARMARSVPGVLAVRAVLAAPREREEGFHMTRELRCAELIPGCDFVAQGTCDSDVMTKTAEHAKRAHRMIAIAMQVERKARAAIRDVAA